MIKREHWAIGLILLLYGSAPLQAASTLIEQLSMDAYFPGVHWAQPSKNSQVMREWNQCLAQSKGLAGIAPSSQAWIENRLNLPLPDYRNREQKTFDWHQLNRDKGLNLILDPGDYLSWSDVPSVVFVLDQQGVTALPYVPNQDVREYLSTFDSSLSVSGLWWVTPAGQAQQAPSKLIGWRRQPLLPGALILNPPGDLLRDRSGFLDCVATWLGHFSYADWVRLSGLSNDRERLSAVGPD